MEDVLVSIIIPAYNAEKYIADAIQSALATTYRRYEIIVVNDGSTDRTQEIIDELAFRYPVIHTFYQPNAGASAARNHAIRKSKGTYILPLDADNLLAPEYVSEAVKILSENPGVKLVSSEAELIGEKSGKWELDDFDINLLCRRNLIDNCAMYRRADWEKAGGYCDEILGREDWDFWLSLFETGGQFVRLPMTGFYYRVRSDSKRVQTRHLHKKIIDALNIRHMPLFHRELNGSLHYQRTYSKAINSVINIFRPHNVFVKTENLHVQKMVYAANVAGEAKRLLRMKDDEVRYITFVEKRFHFPGTKISKSSARTYFEPTNPLHLGYYEEQVSFWHLKSYLVLTTRDYLSDLQSA